MVKRILIACAYIEAWVDVGGYPSETLICETWSHTMEMSTCELQGNTSPQSKLKCLGQKVEGMM